MLAAALVATLIGSCAENETGDAEFGPEELVGT
jgi:hypothetical protein